MTNNKLINTTGKILVHKNVEHVFDFFADPSNDSIWRTEINQSTLDGALKLGVKVSEYSYLSKKVSNHLIQLTCMAFDRGKQAVFETPTHAPFYLKSRRQTKAISDNTTEIIYTLDFDTGIVKHALGIGLPKFIVSFKANSDMKKYLQQLKKHLEKV